MAKAASTAAPDTSDVRSLTTVSSTLGSGLHVRKIDRASELKRAELTMADQLLACEVHPEIHRLLLLYPLQRLEFAVDPKRDERLGEVRLAMRIEAGKQYGNPDSGFVAQRQDVALEALWVALPHKIGAHVYRRLRALGAWTVADGVMGAYQAARQEGVAVSRQALASEPFYFAETFASTLTQKQVPEELQWQHQTFLELLLRA
ncbi:hypothetical protein [Deinococcus ruber]|nr:hypothetical protein [Deinococcus ruber]